MSAFFLALKIIFHTRVTSAKARLYGRCLEICLHVYGANRKKQCVRLKSKVREISRRLVYVLRATDVLRQILTCVFQC
jgi:hypothetical protein